MVSNKELQKAINVLCNELKRDWGYRRGWEANISMAIFDEWERRREKKKYLNRKDMLDICNTGAINFLHLLAKEKDNGN